MLSELSNISEVVNGPILYITAISMVMLIGITGLMIYFTFRYSRRRNPNPEDIHGHQMLEIVWTVVPTLIAFSMFWYGWVGYKFMKSPPDDAMRVEVTGRMWSWTHEYENGIETEELKIPVGQPVRLDLQSQDVLHSYYIPAFKVKQDVVPGVDGLFLWFTAKKEGTYQVFCAEYCGLQHSYMLTKVHVVPEAEFNSWYEEEGRKVAEMKAALAEVEGEGEGEGGGNLHVIGQSLSQSKGCIACHSADGSALIGPSFKGLFGKTETVVTGGQEREITVDEDYIRSSIVAPADDIVKGFQNLMPSQAGLVSDAEVNAIIEYIKSLE